MKNDKNSIISDKMHDKILHAMNDFFRDNATEIKDIDSVALAFLSLQKTEITLLALLDKEKKFGDLVAENGNKIASLMFSMMETIRNHYIGSKQ